MGERVLRWGILSTAHINRKLVPPLQSSERNRLEAVASRDAHRAGEYAGQWGIPRAYGSYEALLDDPEIDVVYISLPNSLHAEWAIKAAQAGKHVLCEKPLAMSVQEVDAMAQAARQAGIVLAEAFMYRHHPLTWKVKELVDDGILGKLQLIRGSYSFLLADPANIRLQAGLGGGAIWDIGCYPLSYARFLAGGDPLEVFGWQTTGEGGVNLSLAGQMCFTSGLISQVDCSFQTPYRTMIEVIGSEGNIRIPMPYAPQLNEKIELKRGHDLEIITIPGSDLYQGEVEDMADAILEGRDSRINLADSRGNVASIVALLESAHTGQPVTVGS